MLEKFGETKRWSGVPMEKIIADLKAQPNYYAVPESPRDYIVNGVVSADDLRTLVDLPYEISITESAHRLVLTTGYYGRPYDRKDRETKNRHLNSELSFHTHPPIDPEISRVIPDAPSFADLVTDIARDRNLPPSIIAHSKGLLVYRFVAAPSLSEADRLILECENRENLLNPATGNHTDDLRRMALIQRKFALETQSILAEAQWDETRKIEKIMEAFRLTNKA